jgi:hypothetical protein
MKPGTGCPAPARATHSDLVLTWRVREAPRGSTVDRAGNRLVSPAGVGVVRQLCGAVRNVASCSEDLQAQLGRTGAVEAMCGPRPADARARCGAR